MLPTLLLTLSTLASGPAVTSSPLPVNREAAAAHVKQRAEAARHARSQGVAMPLHGGCPTDSGFLDWLDSRTDRPTPGLARRKAASVSLVDGVIVMEDDGTLTRNDNPVDLAGLAYLFEPDGAGYDMSRVPMAYEEDIGAELFAGQNDWTAEQVTLANFTFPFGGVDRTELFVTPAMVIALEAPQAPAGDQLLAGDVLFDRSPRIGPLQQAARFNGRDAFFREAADLAVITWRSGELDVQVVLHSDGRIVMNYRSTTGVTMGSPVVVTGNADWWNELAPGGSTPDDVGEVGVPAPDGPAVDLTELRAFQVAGTELLMLELVLAGAPPADTEFNLQYSVQVRDEPGQDPIRQVNAEWSEGDWNWREGPIEVDGNIVRYFFLKSELALTDDDIEFVAWTGRDWNWLDPVGLLANWTELPVLPVSLDVSETNRFHSHGPLFESFTIPELLVGPVYQAFNERFGSPRIDGLAIYQTFATDIQFYAGAYSTVGNPGADGIGLAGTAQPERPALLHMNQLRFGWNATDDGTATVLNHEFGHHWLYFVNILEDGMQSNILSPLGGHPAGYVHLPAASEVATPEDSSCMGGATWTDNGDGTFTSPPGWTVRGYHAHELYLMGLYPPEDVPDWYYIKDADPALPQAYWAPQDITVTGERVNVSLSQLIDHEGPRFPDSTMSRRDFLVPMVLVTRPGELGPDDVANLVHTCEVWSDAFGRATDDLATVTCNRVGLRPPNARIVDPPEDLTVTVGDTVPFLGAFDDEDEEDVTLSWSFDAQAPDVTGEGPHDVTFTTAGTYTIQLEAEDQAGLVDDTPDQRTITVNCRTPDGVDDLRVTRTADDDIHFTWSDLVPAPDEYVILESVPFSLLESAAGAVTGAEGLSFPMPSGTLRFYKVAARNLPDCVGP